MTSQALSNPFELHTKLLQSISLTKTGFVLIGKLLYELQSNDLYRLAVGEGIDTWGEYISQPEIGLSRGEANRLIQIYEQFVLRLGLSEDTVAEIPVKNLHYLLPLVKRTEDPTSLRGLVADAQNLSQKDFKERVYEAKTDNPVRTYVYMIMKRCNETSILSRVHGITSEDILNVFENEITEL